MYLTKPVKCYHTEQLQKYGFKLETCPYCKGTGIAHQNVFVDIVNGFNKIDLVLSDELDGTYIESSIMRFKCECGNLVDVVSDDTPVACVCGRLYRAIVSLEVNTEYIGKQDELIKLSNET